MGLPGPGFRYDRGRYGPPSPDPWEFRGHRPQCRQSRGLRLVIRTAAVHDSNPEIAGAVARGIPVYERAQAWGAIMQRYPNAPVRLRHPRQDHHHLHVHPHLYGGGGRPHGDDRRHPAPAPLGLSGGPRGYDHFGVLSGVLQELSQFLPHRCCDFECGGGSSGFLQGSPGYRALLSTVRGSGARCRRRHRQCATTRALWTPWRGFRTRCLPSVWSIPPTARRPTSRGGWAARCSISGPGERYAHVELHVYGHHNVLNALAAASAAYLLELPGSAVEDGLAAFAGAGRRFERKGTYPGRRSTTIMPTTRMSSTPCLTMAPAPWDMSGYRGLPAPHLYPDGKAV